MKKITLELREDEATGVIGFIPEGCEDFNSFTDSIGLFHDIFEHWFEGKHKYFQDKFKCDRSGELVAMGACYYFYNELGIHNRALGNHRIYPFGYIILRGEFDSLLSNILYEEDSFAYGKNELLCNIPYQKPIEGYFEDNIEETYLAFKKRVEKDLEEADNEYAKEYFKSVTLGKVQTLFRYGYRMAARWIPTNYDNRVILTSFIDFWKIFFEKVNLEYLSDDYQKVTFKIYVKDKTVSWTATFISNDRFIPNIKLTNKTGIYSIKDKFPSYL
jgi:hypothetical protein